MRWVLLCVVGLVGLALAFDGEYVSLQVGGPRFVEVMEDVYLHNVYLNGSYTCVNFTETYNTRLEELGYTVRRLDVDLEGGGRHAISKVVVYVDVTNGLVVDPSEYEEYGIKRIK